MNLVLSFPPQYPDTIVLKQETFDTAPITKIKIFESK